jgi:hypothetical protein
MKVEEIVKNNTKVLTITKELNGLKWPKVLTKYKKIPTVYYIVYKGILVKIGISKNIYSRFCSYRTEVKKLNENLIHGTNGSVLTVLKLNEIMSVGDSAEIYAWFIKPKKQFEIHNGRQVPITVDLIGLETLERKKYKPLLK